MHATIMVICKISEFQKLKCQDVFRLQINEGPFDACTIIVILCCFLFICIACYVHIKHKVLCHYRKADILRCMHGCI